MNSIHILLIEDNEGDIHLTRESLEENIYVEKISVLKNGKEALDYLESNIKIQSILPNLILLDINLPIMNGHEVLQKIKENLNTLHIPVIMLTTSSSPKDIIKSYKNHANSYVVKPVDIDQYKRTINQIVNYWCMVVDLG